MRKKKIIEILGSIARELIELKLGLIKTNMCEKVLPEELAEYLDEEYEQI